MPQRGRGRRQNDAAMQNTLLAPRQASRPLAEAPATDQRLQDIGNIPRVVQRQPFDGHKQLVTFPDGSTAAMHHYDDLFSQGSVEVYGVPGKGTRIRLQDTSGNETHFDLAPKDTEQFIKNSSIHHNLDMQHPWGKNHYLQVMNGVNNTVSLRRTGNGEKPTMYAHSQDNNSVIVASHVWHKIREDIKTIHEHGELDLPPNLKVSVDRSDNGQPAGLAEQLQRRRS